MVRSRCALFGLSLRFSLRFGVFESIAGQVEFEDDTVVDEAVDRSRRRHLVLEDLFPLREGKIAGDRAALIAVGQKRKEDLHLLTRVLDVADVIEDQGVVSVPALEQAGQVEVTLGDQELLDQKISGSEQDASPLMDQVLADRAQEVGLAGAWVSEGHYVFGAVQEIPFQERGYQPVDLPGQPGPVERVQVLLQRQSRLPEQVLNPVVGAHLALAIDELEQVRLVG